MKQVVIPGTTLSVSRLSLGTASLHHVPTRRERQRLLARASELGFTHFDAAPLYGFGLAEDELGRFSSSHPKTITVATKVGLYPPRGSQPIAAAVWVQKALGRLVRSLARPVVSWSVQAAQHSLHRSLRRLRRDYIDLLLLHEPDPRLIDAEEFIRWLQAQRAAGKIRYFGLAGDPARYLVWVTRAHPLCEVLQARDSIDKREADGLRVAGRELQLTFGYLSSSADTGRASIASVITAALTRNRAGSVLVSTRRPEHLEQLAEAAQEASRCT